MSGIKHAKTDELEVKHKMNTAATNITEEILFRSIMQTKQKSAFMKYRP